MDWAILKPIQRLSLLPWSPMPLGVTISQEEQQVLSLAQTWAGVQEISEPGALQTAFATLRIPAVDTHIATVAPPVTYWSPHPDDPPAYEAPDVTKMLNVWQDAFERLQLTAQTPFPRVYDSVVRTAQDYARCLAASSSQPDIPLLLQRQLWSALAACLWITREQAVSEPEMALLVTDLSGIQNYLFGSAKFGVPGVARSLRARSFFLTQIGTLFAFNLLERLGLPPANLLLDAGGKFYILFPATAEAEQIAEQARADAARWCLNDLHGELALNMAYTRFPVAALAKTGFSQVLQKANRTIACEKQRRLRSALCNTQGWDISTFIRPTLFRDRPPCQACGRFAQVQEEKCQFCYQETITGRKLTRAQWIAYDQGKPDAKHTLGAFGWRVELGEGKTVPSSATWGMALSPPSDSAVAMFPRRNLARYVPTDADGYTPMTFEDIAKRAEGRPYLAYLKADVDRLGERFVFGLRGADTTFRDSLPLTGHLSQSLDSFFSGWLERTLRREFPECYVVFSGGDDLTVIGPHNQIIRLAWRLPRSFRRYLGYVSGPPQATDVLTLSAGIALSSYRTPVPIAIQGAEDALEQAKQDGRNRIHLLDRTLTWETYGRMLANIWEEDGTPLPGLGAQLLQEVPSSFLYHLLRYARMWERYRAGNLSELRYQPLLAYDVGRNIDRKKLPELYEWATWLSQIHISDVAEWQEAMDNLGVLIRLVLLHKK